MTRLIHIFALTFSVSTVAQAEAGLVLGLHDVGRFLHVWVLNDSDGSREVNRRFLLGSLERGADVELEVFDADGREFQMTSFAEAAPLRRGDNAILGPNQIVGRAIDKCLLMDAFSLVPGNYVVSVKYSPLVEWRPFAKATFITTERDISFFAECPLRKLSRPDPVTRNLQHTGADTPQG